MSWDKAYAKTAFTGLIGEINSDKLKEEIHIDPVITRSVIAINMDTLNVTITFSAALIQSEVDALDALIAMHKGGFEDSDYKKDSKGRLIVVNQSGNPDYTTQWTYRGDDIVVGVRNKGKSSILKTYDVRDLMNSNLAVSNSGAGYKINALNNVILPNQIPLEFYHKTYTGGTGDPGDVGGWVRKRARLQFLDNLEPLSSRVHYTGGIIEQVFCHPFVFMHNKGVKPDLSNITPFDPNQPHHPDDNPIGFIPPNGNYLEEFPMSGDCQKGVEFKPETAASEIFTGYNAGHPVYSHLIELWFEMTFNTTIFATTPDAHNKASCWMNISTYSMYNIDPV